MITEKTVNYLVRAKLINDVDKQLYRFGINLVYTYILNFGTSVLIGICMNMIWQSVMFFLMYIPLRQYAGGYHAKTPRRCYCLSILLNCCVLTAIKYFPFSKMELIIILTLSFVVVFAKSPQESKNKALSAGEKGLYKKRARLILTIETILVLFCILISLAVAKCITTAICCSACMLLIPVHQA